MRLFTPTRAQLVKDIDKLAQHVAAQDSDLEYERDRNDKLERRYETVLLERESLKERIALFERNVAYEIATDQAARAVKANIDLHNRLGDLRRERDLVLSSLKELVQIIEDGPAGWS